VQASSREIAAATKCSRNKVQAAIDSLTSRGLIATREGTRTKAAAYLLQFLEILSIGGSVREPPQAVTGSAREPQVASLGSHPGSEREPPPTENKGEVFPPSALLIDTALIEILNRALTADSRGRSREQLQHWRHLVTHCTEKLCGRIPWHHPTAQLDVIAKIIEACDGREDAFAEVVFQLQTSTINKLHESPMWWLYVCLQRIQGIGPKHTKARMAELAAAKRPRRIADSQAKLEPESEAAAPNFSEDFSQKVAEAAAGKRLK
jgi:hypothetical protein